MTASLPDRPDRFSFVIPALNEESCIAACVQSIRAQDPPPFEIVVVDNGCVDRTAAIASGLGCIVVREDRPGLSHARNRGAQAARGDILCFIDADGVLAKGWTRAAGKCFADPRIGGASGLSIYTHSNPFKRLWYNVYVVVTNAGALISSRLFSRMIFAGNNLAIRRELFMQIGGYEPVIGEGLWLSRRFWRLAGFRGAFCPGMLLWNSPRGFEHQGFLRTWAYWIRETILRGSQTGYTYKSGKSIIPLEGADMWSQLKTLPNQLTALRLVLIPVMWVLAVLKLPFFIGIGMILSFVTDAVDGRLARRLNQVSDFGSKFDSLTDNILLPSALVWLWMLRPDMYRENVAVCLICIVAYFSALLLGMIKFRRFANLHLFTSKVSTVAMYLFISQAFIAEAYNPILFYLAAATFLVASIESNILLIISSEVNEHMVSVVYVLQSRRSGRVAR